MQKMTDRDALLACQTITPICMTGEQAIARLQTINVLVYAQLGHKGAAEHYDKRVAEHGDGNTWKR